MTGISRMLDFISLLKQNNNREWFSEHKAEYLEIRQQCFEEIDMLISSICLFDNSLAGATHKECTYRIYRDLRFSPDKTPFKTHFGIVLARHGKNCKEAGYYLHIEPGECALYGGVWFPEQKILNFLRHNIHENIEEFVEIMETPAFKENFPKLEGDKLKAMPRGFPKDCPHGEILKMKEFLVRKPYPDDFFDKKGWMEKVTDDIRTLKPFTDFLNFAFEEMHA